MRFFRATLLALAALATTCDAAGSFRFQFSADNSFQMYLSHKSSPSVVEQLADHDTKKQDEWWTATTYQAPMILEPGDVISVYMHNVIDHITDPKKNPSALVGRILQLDAVPNPATWVTDSSWFCTWRHEVDGQAGDAVTNYDPTRFYGHAGTGDEDTWARSDFDAVNTEVPLLNQQYGAKTFKPAISLGLLGDTSTHWSKQGDFGLMVSLGGPNWSPSSTRPHWIYAYDPHTHTDINGNPLQLLAHHAWCRFTVPQFTSPPTPTPTPATPTPTPTPTPCPPGGCGDPQFVGFQGQSFQFHGLPDEHFNLVSSSNVQLNAHFVFIAAGGKCDYDETQCWSHPGTYMDMLGFTVAETQIRITAGPHHAGLRVWSNGTELIRGDILQLSNYTDATLTYHHNGRVHIDTEMISFDVINSDYFVNFGAALNSEELMVAGRTHHTITDQTICKANYADSGDYRVVEKLVSEKYPIKTSLHGLVGQTWRNIKVCGREWMGTVEDYLVSSLFASDYHYNYFNW